MTKSQDIAQQLAALFRARNPLIKVVTREEARVEGHLVQAAAAAGYSTLFWDVAQGFTDINGKNVSPAQDPGDALDYIRSRATGQQPGRCVFVMRDLSAWLAGQAGVVTQRKLRNLVRLLPGVARDNSQAVVILGPTTELPAELSGHTTVIDWPLPDREEIADILDATLASVPEEYRATNGTRDAAIDAALGLSGEEAQACFAKSLVQLKRIDATVVANEKKNVIARERVLEWYDPLPDGLDAVGGLDNLKSWLKARTCAYTPEARAYGIPAPRGVFLAGISGCGKTYTSRAIATALQCPMVRLDPNALKSKYVGESEQQLRKALDVIGALGKCVVLIDEIEKALQGATSGSADGGVSADTLGTLLTWMNDRVGEAFVVATANDITGLPPELLRKGRWDELWFVDLPNGEERKEVLLASLKKFKAKYAAIDLDAVSKATEGFAGSEIAAIVPDSMFVAFSDGARPITTEDLVAAAGNVTPLSETAKEKITKMRDWAAGRARPATAPAAKQGGVKSGRVIEI